jgi:nitroreductase
MLTQETKIELTSYLEKNATDFNGVSVPIQLIEKVSVNSDRMKLDYGLIKGHQTYLLGTIENNLISRVSYGYVMEKAVLNATSLGLDSCWVGYFDSQYFKEIELTDGKVIPSIVIIGYGLSKQSFTDNILRKIVGATRRKAWSGLFYNYSNLNPLAEAEAGILAEPFEMLRLAPSSGNTQPWRVFYNIGDSIVHFFKKPISARYEKDGLHDIDMGIALSHFDLALQNLGIKGVWTLTEKPVVVQEGLQYILSWKRG